jgi:deoxyribose-phosphate aldolase
MGLTMAELAKMIDHTLLKAFISNEDLKKHCEDAIKYGFKTVAINNAQVSFCKKILEGTDILCDAAVGFPLGQSTIETKVFETKDVIKKGAKEVDYVINIVELKNRNFSYIEDEMERIVDVCNREGIVSKVIFETCYLTDDEKRKLCEIALKVRPTFIKTSTGFGTGGATINDVKLMKECVGDNIKIKASGGIRNIDDALSMIAAGASRLGTSQGVKIIEEYKERLNK